MSHIVVLSPPQESIPRSTQREFNELHLLLDVELASIGFSRTHIRTLTDRQHPSAIQKADFVIALPGFLCPPPANLDVAKVSKKDIIYAVVEDLPNLLIWSDGAMRRVSGEQRPVFLTAPSSISLANKVRGVLVLLTEHHRPVSPEAMKGSLVH